MSSEILAGRATSAFPVSIGTSLSLESISDSGGAPYDPDRQIPQKINIRDYDSFWINLSTLFRNLYSAVPRSDIQSARPEDCADAMLQEMQFIDGLIQAESVSLTKTHYYVCSYKTVKQRYPKANVRGVITDNQIAYKLKHDKTIQLVLNMYHDQTKLEITDMDLKPVHYPTTLILTHQAHDLLSHPKFKRLDLLESFTGKLKKKNLWYTKYSNGEHLGMMPFDRVLMQVFGDSDLFHPMSIKLRNDIIELAKAKHWTFATTKDKIHADIRTLKNQYASFIIDTLK